MHIHERPELRKDGIFFEAGSAKGINDVFSYNFQFSPGYKLTENFTLGVGIGFVNYDNRTDLKNELIESATLIQTQSQEIEALKSQYETLKVANSLLGSDDNKRDTKLKINSLIREIDYCIAQLSD